MKATEVTAGLAESNGSLLPGPWHDSLHVTCGLSDCTPGSAPGPTLVNEYGKTLPLTGGPCTRGPRTLRTLPTPLSRHYDCLVCDCCCCPDRPRFHCHRSHRSQLHASNVSIACVLRHNPDPKEIYVTWQHGGAHRVDAGNSYGEEYRLSKSVGIFANVKQTVMLSNVTFLMIFGGF